MASRPNGLGQTAYDQGPIDTAKRTWYAVRMDSTERADSGHEGTRAREHEEGTMLGTTDYGSDRPAVYDRSLEGYDREQCDACGEWMPWPALEDHACDALEDALEAFYADDDPDARADRHPRITADALADVLADVLEAEAEADALEAAREAADLEAAMVALCAREAAWEDTRDVPPMA